MIAWVAAGRIGLALAYVGVYVWCYVTFLHGNFGYVGYDLFERPAVFLAASAALAVLPVLLYRGVRAVSSIIAGMVYFALYVPIIVTFALGADRSLAEILLIELTFATGMALLFLADAVVVDAPVRLDLGYDLMPLVLALTVAATLYMVLLYRDNLHFSGFGDELYELRSANEAIGDDLVTRYVSSWLSTVLVPLCLAYGLTTKRHRYWIAATATCLILYMAAANKISILLPFMFIGFYAVMRARLRYAFLAMGITLALFVAVTTPVGPDAGAAFVASAILLNRTIGNGGQLAMAYYDFFEFHPRTYYSHVHGIALVTDPYPYGDLIIGQVVGRHYWSDLANANASFWATDGIAALGLSGVIVASFLCFGLFILMNTLTRRYAPMFVTLCFLPFVVTLLNQSLFSSIWSGGAAFLLLFCLLNGRNAVTDTPTSVPSGPAVT